MMKYIYPLLIKYLPALFLWGTSACVNDWGEATEQHDAGHLTYVQETDSNNSSDDEIEIENPHEDISNEEKPNDGQPDEEPIDETPLPPAPNAYCEEHIGFEPSPLGADNTLELMTWNIEFYPQRGAETVKHVEEALLKSQLDIIGLHEVTSEDVFFDLLNCLSEYQGIVSTHTYNQSWSDQKVALLFRPERFELDEWYLMDGSSYGFPRPVLVAEGHLLEGDQRLPTNIYVLHLKAGWDAESADRREVGAYELAEFIRGERITSPDRTHIVMGDFNSTPGVNAPSPVFAYFDQDFTLASPNYGIDHILVDDILLQQYEIIDTAEMNLPDIIPDYAAVVSDHEPMVGILNQLP